jgi:bifunctional non-homologous end joining protein LigD
VRARAFHVEDHPIEYIDFEGVIPARQYGGGDVIVWDAGTWAPVRESTRPTRCAPVADRRGAHGTGRREAARPVRPGAHPQDASGKEEWLLLHKNDEFAAAGWNAGTGRGRCSVGRHERLRSRPTPTGSWRSYLPAARAAVLLKPGRRFGAEDWRSWTRSANPGCGRSMGGTSSSLASTP